MIDLGDRPEDSSVSHTFATKNASQAPTTLAGSPAVGVYKDGVATVSTAGITLTTDFDAVTGLNLLEIDLASDAFYSPGSDYHAVVTSGTVDGVSYVGTVLAEFSIANRSLQTISPSSINRGRTWRVSETAAGYVSDKEIILPPGFSGTLAFDFSELRNPRTSLDSVVSVTDVTSPANSPPITITNARVNAERRQVHFSVANLTDGLTYRMRCVATTIDGHTIPIVGVLKSRSS